MFYRYDKLENPADKVKNVFRNFKGGNNIRVVVGVPATGKS